MPKELEPITVFPEERSEYVYSETLKAYVSTEPLKIDENVVRAAEKCDIKLSWDDEGRINNISLIDAKKLTNELGVTLLSPQEYWQVLAEAKEKGNTFLVEELQSNQYAEWLDVVYRKDEQGNVWAVEHPELLKNDDGSTFVGEWKSVRVPFGRPGWFDPINNIDDKTGIPKEIETNRAKGSRAWSSSTWKFWSFYNCDQGLPVSPIRNWVISSGTPSFDMDLPVSASQEALMLRIVRQQLPEKPIEQDVVDKANKLIFKYLKTTVKYPAIQNQKDHEDFYKTKDDLFGFLEEHGKTIVTLKEKNIQPIKEKLIDMLGEIKIMASVKGDQEVVDKVDELSHGLFKSTERVTVDMLLDFVKSSKERLGLAIKEKKKLVFVMGHKNPDTDTVVSTLFEALRYNLVNKEMVVIPVVQGNRIPDEIVKLIGSEIANNILVSEDEDYKKSTLLGQTRWIIVDHNVSEVQRFVLSIVDHHILSDKARKQDIPITWEMAGSATSLIIQKFYGLGIKLDAPLARIAYGATLMDTEDRSERKMTFKDKLIMDDLQKNAGLVNEKEFFKGLMSQLLNTEDAELLFDRDYKQDWGIFGFAVAKVKGAFDSEGLEIKKDLLSNLVRLGKNNNEAKNFPLTIIKVADYLDDNQTVNKERVYLIFNKYVMPEFKNTLFEFMSRIIQFEFKGKAKISVGDNYIDFSGVGDQLSRKVTAPFLEPIVNAYNEFYYSPETNLYVGREMLKVNRAVLDSAGKLGITLTWDKEGRINNITFNEAKLLLKHLDYKMMSLPEYWQVSKEAKEVHDEQLTNHLKSKGFVEFTDSVIVNKNEIINHPDLSYSDDAISYDGLHKSVNIPTALPGLIYEDDIDLETGFPSKVYPPTHYGEESVIRYWSPDAQYCVPTRGYIFLLGKMAFDCKIHPDDAFPQLGIRPCLTEIKPPSVRITVDTDGVNAIIDE